MQNDTLVELETAAIESIGLGSLVKGAAQSLQLIEPWWHHDIVKSDHPVVKTLIQNIRVQSKEYYLALDLSIRTVENGYTFCTDAEYLCEFLLDPNTTTQDLHEFICDMKQIAKEAHEEAKIMSEKFRGVRQNLMQITKGIMPDVKQVQQQEQRAREQVAVAKRRRDHSTFGVAIATAATGVVTASIAIVGAGFPPVLLIFPVVLPIFGIICGTVSLHYSQKMDRRETEAKSCVDAMTQLRKAAEDLSVIVENVNGFADWWLQMDTMLEAVKSKVGRLKVNHVVKLQVKSIKMEWGKVKGEYMNYKVQVNKLQDYYPATRLQSTATTSEAVLRRRSIGV